MVRELSAARSPTDQRALEPGVHVRAVIVRKCLLRRPSSRQVRVVYPVGNWCAFRKVNQMAGSAITVIEPAGLRIYHQFLVWCDRPALLGITRASHSRAHQFIGWLPVDGHSVNRGVANREM